MKELATRNRMYKIRPYLFILPAILFLGVFVIYPVFDLMIRSFQNWNLVNPPTWAGIRNYQIIFRKRDFMDALINTAVYTVFSVSIQLIVAIVIAAWLRKSKPINNLTRTAMFMPHIISLLSIAMVWMWLMDEKAGLLNVILSWFGIPGLRWLQSSETAMMSIIIVSIWKSLGYHTMIIYAALQGVPTELYEAAELDNAGRIRTFFRITLPMISPQTFMLLITMTIGSFKVFETIRIMTGGGPGSATEVLVYYIYEQAFYYQKVGLASAAGVVLLAIVGMLTAVYFLALSKKVHYQ